MGFNRMVGSTVAAAVLVVLAASPALAEGEIHSSISGWLPGKETSDWNDKHTDADKTTLQNNRCSSDTGNNVTSLTWELNRNDTVTPDEHYGNKKLTCTATSAATTASWGERGKGNFDATLKQVNGYSPSPVGAAYSKNVNIRY